MAKKQSGSSRPARLRQVKPDDIIMNAEIEQEIKALKKRKVNLTGKASSEIQKWDKAVVGKFYRPIKKQITVRIDADVLDWFKRSTNKYQTLINQACREYMTQQSGQKS